MVMQRPFRVQSFGFFVDQTKHIRLERDYTDSFFIR
jgi:hypothetical protein